MLRKPSASTEPLPLCDWNFIPHSLDSDVLPLPEPVLHSAIDRFIQNWEWHQLHPKLAWDPFQDATPWRGANSFWRHLQGNYGAPESVFSIPTMRQPVSEASLDRKIAWAEQDCRLYDLMKPRFNLPWVVCQKANAAPPPIVTWLREKIRSLSEDAPNALTSDPSRQLDTARRLFELLSAPGDAGGLGLDFDGVQQVPHRDWTAIDRDRKIACAEFTSLFLFAAPELGLRAVPIALFGSNGGTEQEHLMVGLLDAGGRIAAVADHMTGYFGPPDLAWGAWRALSREDFLIYLENLQAARDPDRKRGEARLDAALRLKPNHYLSLFNKATFRGLAGEPREALRLLKDSIRDFPRYVPSYQNLAFFAESVDDRTLRQWALAVRDQLRPEPE